MDQPTTAPGPVVERTTALALEEKRKLKKSLRRFDMVFFTVCAFVGLDTLGTVASNGGGLRIGVSGVGPTAVRARAAEQSRNPDDVLRDVEPVDDAVASAEYRRKMLPVLLRRALDQLETA